MLIDKDLILKKLEKMSDYGKEYAKAKANRVYIEQYRKSKKAILMTASGLKTSAAQETYAYSHPEYLQLLDGLKDAVEIETKAWWAFENMRILVEVWRTDSANTRNIERQL